MNSHNVTDYVVKNQEKKSWIDDPFDIEDSLTRFKIVSNTKVNLYDYAESLIAQYGIYQYSRYHLTVPMLPDEEQKELVRLYIESIDRNIEYACYGDDESINSEFLCTMLSMLKNDNQKTRQQFAETTINNLLVYYHSNLNDVLFEAADSYLSKCYQDADMRQLQHDDNGEKYWGAL